jgi:VacB/RNase II family 3'-5' exoribonuclease
MVQFVITRPGRKGKHTLLDPAVADPTSDVMTNPQEPSDRVRLQRVAHQAMIDRGLEPDFPGPALAELGQIHGPAAAADGSVRDLRKLLWCSIDNDDSRDLDQLTVAEAMPDGAVKALVAIADVDALVRKRSALDDHARKNTTSVYTVGQIFPMLPEKLSTDFTSLGFDADRLAIVLEMTFDREGVLTASAHHRALVRNHAKLAYNSVAAWLDNTGPMPQEIGKVGGLDANIKLQDQLAQKLKAQRHRLGALELETIQTRPVFDGAMLRDLVDDRRNRAKDIIEDFMIAANGATARFLASCNRSSVRRVVRTPKHWDRIVELAAESGATLPKDPDSRELQLFLVAAKKRDPLRFPDLSLSVIKLLGSGEYVVERPGGQVAGHFGLAVRDYAHSTAPNRRYPDVIIQRLLKSALAKSPQPYADDELDAIALHCTEAEDAAKKIERQVSKCAGVLLLRSRIGARFDAIVTGASDKGTWVRLQHPPIEGKLIAGFEGAKVGAIVCVELVRVDLESCYIDFKRVPDGSGKGR